LATGSRDGTINLWNTTSFEKVRTIPAHQGTVCSIAFTSDGKRMASGAEDKLAKIWEVASGDLIHELKGHSQRVWGVAFMPDGSRLATGSADLTVRLWEAQRGVSVLILSDFTNPLYNLVSSCRQLFCLLKFYGRSLCRKSKDFIDKRLRQIFKQVENWSPMFWKTKLIMLIALATMIHLTGVAKAQENLSEPLAWFKPFIGKTWKGKFSDA
jgi:WD40 repeat protein